MKYTISTPTYKVNTNDDLIVAKMRTSNISDSRNEMAQLINVEGEILQISYPMLVSEADYRGIAAGYDLYNS